MAPSWYDWNRTEFWNPHHVCTWATWTTQDSRWHVRKPGSSRDPWSTVITQWACIRASIPGPRYRPKARCKVRYFHPLPSLSLCGTFFWTNLGFARWRKFEFCWFGRARGSTKAGRIFSSSRRNGVVPCRGCGRWKSKACDGCGKLLEGWARLKLRAKRSKESCVSKFWFS